MPLFEVSHKHLKQDEAGILYRFFQDSKEDLNLYIWQNENMIEASDFGIEKFQIAHKNHILEWKKNSKLKYGRIDEGDNPMGMKRSPMICLREEVDVDELKFIIFYIKNIDDNKLKEKNFLLDIMNSKLN